MPWEGTSGRIYELALLDTNVLSEIVKHPAREGRGFLELFASRSLAPCFTPYNLLELYGAPAVYDRFVEFFSQFPIFMTVSLELLLDREIQYFDGGPKVNPLLNAFTPDGPDPSYDLRGTLESVFGDPETQAALSAGDSHASAMHILDFWLGNKDNFEPAHALANAADAKRYVEESGFQSLAGLRPEWVKDKLDGGVVPAAHSFPSLATMLYSQYWRFWDPSWKAAPGEVRDIQIMAIAPYMDVAVTEKRQAEIFRKISGSVAGLEHLSVLRLRDLRRGEV